MTGVLTLALALFVTLSLGSLQLGARVTGPGGAAVALVLYAAVGLAAWVVAVALGVAAVRLLAARPIGLPSWEAAGYLCATLFASVLLHLGGAGYRLQGYASGGLFGEYCAELMVALLGTVGTVLVAVTGLLLALFASTPLTAASLGRGGLSLLRSGWRGFAGLAVAAFPQPSEGSAAGGDDDDQAIPAVTVELEATRPMAPRPTARAGRGPLGGRLLGAAAAAAGGAAGATGSTQLAPAAPPPAADEEAVALLARGRRRRGALDADAAVHSDLAASHNTRPLGLAGASPAPPPEAVAAASPAEASQPLNAAAPPLPVIKVPPRRTPPSGPLAQRESRLAEPVAAGRAAAASDEPTPEAVQAEDDRTEVSTAPPAALARGAATVADEVPEIIETPARAAPRPAATAAGAAATPTVRGSARPPLDYIRLGSGPFRGPHLDLLDYPESAHAELDRQAMLDLAGRLEKTLGDYGVRGRVSEIHPGPVVTMYEFVPQAGTKLSKITALSNDLAMALEALKVRIVAPIPGKAAVGIEVPNRTRETVYFKEIVASETFARATRSKLAMALGKDIVGNPVVVDLAKMPHLLLAGTTGSGKSVSVNAMICSLLFNASPDEVKLIMIDPKMLELSIYEGIPHLLLPVVTDPKKANLALRWAVEEMERRYDLISRAGVRDIGSYNKKVEKRLADSPPPPRPAEPPRAMVKLTMGEGADRREIEVEASVEAVEAAGGVVDSQILDEISAARAIAQTAAMQQMQLAAVEPERKLPYIVIVIDEFADLMMVASKEVEMSVARIAQKARAAGIHLMLATQRPSVDVITGLIKANFPSRIAFQVASKIDARTILDQQGAESLLGMGDMLFSDRGLALKRVHGPLVTDVEIHRVVEHLRSQGKPVYDLEILKPRPEDGEEGGGDEEWDDDMYDQAVAVVSEMRQASTSMLQRRLRLGYNRAARMIERMEREGIVGPADGARPREVLVRSHAA